MSLMEAGFNLPPGVTGNEPQITGQWPCRECGRPLPEEPVCPNCDAGEMDFIDSTPIGGSREYFACEKCGYELPVDFDTCPGGCREPEWEANDGD